MLVSAAFLSQNRSFLMWPTTVLFGPSSSTTSIELTAAAISGVQSRGAFMPPCSSKKRLGSLNTTRDSSSTTLPWLTSKSCSSFARMALILADTLLSFSTSCARR